MSSIRGFQEGKIDGKSFLIYTSSSSSSPSNEGNNDLLQPLFICPTLRTHCNSDYVFSISPHFPTSRNGDQLVRDLLESDSHDDICKLPVAPLFWCNNKNSTYQYHCDVCETSYCGTDHYFCVTCDKIFHKECVESPSKIKHPSHPFLSFQLSILIELHLKCFCCEANVNGISYSCHTSRLNIHPVCAMKPIPIVIDHLKSHSHPLTFFPKQAFLPCNVCGLIIESISTYLCLPCVFVVHQDCIYFPKVIRISRHHHRISFISSLPCGEWSCGVCRKEVDNHYGAYACNKCDGYFIHPRCALRRDLWDGEELEGIPEEPEIVVEPFEVIAEGIILHFSHGHHLKLEVSTAYDKDQFCQACVLPIYESNYYSCMDKCDFILHEVCADAPRRKYHPLHAHPLTLKVVTDQYQYKRDQCYFRCDACFRTSCGFVYENDQGSQAFRLDLRCASVSEPFEYQGHEHPLFLALSPEEDYVKSATIVIVLVED